MGDSKELKPKSFRIDDQTAAKFKAIAESIGGNQQEALAKLIETFEFQSGKAVLTEKKADIEQFEKYVNAITRMFMSSLEDNQNITETVRTEFDALLKSKDATIQDLQEKLEKEKRCQEEAAVKADAFSEENASLNKLIEGMRKEYSTKVDDMQTMLQDKDSLNKALTDSCNDLKQKVDAMQQEQKQLIPLQAMNSELQEKLGKAENTISGLEKQLESEVSEIRQSKESELKQVKEQAKIEKEKALLAQEKKYQEQIQRLKEEKQAEVDKYQSKYFELLEQMKSAPQELR